MKSLIKSLPQLAKRLDKAEGLVLMLDFDGTISPLAPTPAKAFLPAAIKELVKKCAKFFPVVIISGRALEDVKRKVGVKGLVYAGSHGMEWQFGRRKNHVIFPTKLLAYLQSAKNIFFELKKKYPGVVIEDKHSTLALHYRLVSAVKIKSLKKDLKKMLEPFLAQKKLAITEGKKVIELRPRVNWDKGSFARLVYKNLQKKYKKKMLPIYIGDDVTDEDVFRVLKFGVTVKVGKNSISKAGYYVKDFKQTKLFLKWLCHRGSVWLAS
jgi:trehalose 6-phosphate phosphatase